VFAPTNEAFAKLPAGVLPNLLKPENKAELVDLLTYHVVAGVVHAEELKDGQVLTTVEGKSVTVRLAGKTVLVNSAVVTTANVEASNGVVHIIDGVLLPTPVGDASVSHAHAAGNNTGVAGPGGLDSAAPANATAPSGTGNHLWFRYVNLFGDGSLCKNGFCRCGEVDAAPRMPASMFSRSLASRLALKRYADLTVKSYNTFAMTNDDDEGKNHLQVGRCADVGYTVKQSQMGGIGWAPNDLMSGICQTQCGCDYPCADQPDQPSRGKWCSLCGPKYNSYITIQLYNAPDHQ